TYLYSHFSTNDGRLFARNPTIPCDIQYWIYLHVSYRKIRNWHIVVNVNLFRFSQKNVDFSFSKDRVAFLHSAYPKQENRLLQKKPLFRQTFYKSYPPPLVSKASYNRREALPAIHLYQDE